MTSRGMVLSMLPGVDSLASTVATYEPNTRMPVPLMCRALVPQSSRAAVYFEPIIFTDENRYNQRSSLFTALAYRKFSGDCSWDPR